ncbi:hypothetical protein AAFF_G00140830 [Aldrovandia affinis]|uniref:Uncharacterized protein n=1 Tax=Aldrovandia affinis TaxID=143900 RepID=A0AAD7TCF0_9TELE|nr:hypothetical protein AAFF_G00140830 [Aldrovandia affinis]
MWSLQTGQPSCPLLDRSPIIWGMQRNGVSPASAVHLNRKHRVLTGGIRRRKCGGNAARKVGGGDELGSQSSDAQGGGRGSAEADFEWCPALWSVQEQGVMG